MMKYWTVLVMASLATPLAWPPDLARAGLILDPAEDILLTYTGQQLPGMDVVAHEVSLQEDRLILFGRMAGPIAPTQAIGALYLFGLDRGQGTPRFLGPAAPPIIGPNVLWDSILRINPDGTGLFNNIIAGVVTPLNPADISINGNEFTASVPVSLLLPAATRSPDQWTYNLWPRNGVGMNVQVSDVAPDDGNSPVQAVPEPASMLLLGTGAIVVGLLVARRRRWWSADLYTQKTRAVAFAISVATLLTCAPRVACADIFQWEYVNPANPSLGKQASTMLCPDGVGVDAEPGAILVNRNLTKAYLVGAGLGLVPIFDEYGEFVGFTAAANLAGANLSQADLSNASFWSATLNNANLSEADLSHAYFHWASLNGANLSQANLTHARFSAFAYHSADMPGASLSQANLSQANLTNAIFGGYRLYDSSYGYIITPGANLTGANLSRADARGARFDYATLTGANTSNLIQSDGHIAGLDLTAGASLVVRDYDGNPYALPQAGPLPIVVEQHLVMNATGTLRLVFEADAWDSTISFAPGIPVALGGTLDLAFAVGVDPAGQLGRTLDLFDWTGVSPAGSFTVTSPYGWDLSRLYATGEATLIAAGGLVLGDFTGNAVVDAGDLSQWKGDFAQDGGSDADHDGDSDGADFLAWQRQLGASSPATNSLDAVPEPASSSLGVLCVLTSGAAGLRRRLNRSSEQS